MFPHYVAKDKILKKNVIERKMSVLSETCLIVGRTERVIIISVHKCT
jgi:hypothetical protein